MNLTAALQGKAQQQNAAAVADGQEFPLRCTRAGQLLTADWKTELVLAGLAFNVSVGGISAGADVALITGGGAGTVIDSDKPEMAIGTPAGYYHIPLGFFCAVQQDMDADTEECNILLFADLAKSIPLPVLASSTIETPQNLLDGSRASVSWAQSAVTTDIVDPVASLILGYATSQAAQISAAGTIVATNRLDYDPSFPTLLKGPCSVVACFGGTSAATGICAYNWAEVPIARFE